MALFNVQSNLRQSIGIMKRSHENGKSEVMAVRIGSFSRWFYSRQRLHKRYVFLNENASVWIVEKGYENGGVDAYRFLRFWRGGNGDKGKRISADVQ